MAQSAAHPDWTLPEVPVPESVPHRSIVELVAALLAAWAARTGRNAFVARNLAFRWDEEHPRFGVDPDVCLFEPSPPAAETLSSALLWKPGHSVPRLAIEVVSRNHPYKDYAVVPDKYAASGVGELWVFDHELIGPRKQGGPHRLQLWTRSADGSFVRQYAGEGPMLSPVLNAWAFAQDEGRRLRIADDEACTSIWLTSEEAERAAKEAALRRVAELEAELGSRQALKNRARSPG
jgi:Uma2 family endonuclease